MSGLQVARLKENRGWNQALKRIFDELDVNSTTFKQCMIDDDGRVNKAKRKWREVVGASAFTAQRNGRAKAR